MCHRNIITVTELARPTVACFRTRDRRCAWLRRIAPNTSMTLKLMLTYLLAYSSRNATVARK